MIDLSEFRPAGNGFDNDTAAIKAWLDALIRLGEPGYWNAGTYLVDEGALVLDCHGQDRAFPRIETAGYFQTILKGSGKAVAPLLTITNGVEASFAHKGGWRGGDIEGGLTFRDGRGAGLAIQGLWYTQFGPMSFISLGSHGVELLRKLPVDPANVMGCRFVMIEAAYCNGWALYNNNGVGMSNCYIGILRAVQTAGGWFGFGAANTIESASMSGPRGWAFDDGTHDGRQGGSPSRTRIGGAELDNVQNGFRINSTTELAASARFVHRFNVGLNKGEGYWPRNCLEIGGGTVPGASRRIAINLIHRLESDGARSDLGVFANGNNTGNNVGIFLDHQVIDAPGFAITNDELSNGFRFNAVARITRDSRVIHDSI